MPSHQVSRRRFMGVAGALGLAGVAGAGGLTTVERVIERALRSDPAGSGSLADIDHIVLLMHENRSFDHYFGTMSGVRGFDDMSPDLIQRGAGLLPFHLDTKFDTNYVPDLDAVIINDPSHSWTTQHAAWNEGAMDAWMSAHLASDRPDLAPEVMGYYTRADVPAHYLLADAFTICDHYFSSVLGPTAPNRMYWMTGTLDPEGTGGGPILSDARAIPDGTLRWRTFPENLLEAGVSWKVYNSPAVTEHSELTGMLKYFRAYRDPDSQLYRSGIAPRFPDDFAVDVRNGTLPSVSWIIPPMQHSEHPSYPPASGANGIMTVVDMLTSNRSLWERTALIVSYDENGGFFDHVAPPTPLPDEAGEFVHGIRHPGQAPRDEPIGLGFRVPALIISPYSQGGLVTSEVFDHTSQLRLVSARFDVPVPNLTSWRDGTVGDMTSVFGPRAHAAPDLSDPHSPAPRGETTALAAALDGYVQPYPVPARSMPRQDRRPLRRRMS